MLEEDDDDEWDCDVSPFGLDKSDEEDEEDGDEGTNSSEERGGDFVFDTEILLLMGFDAALMCEGLVGPIFPFSAADPCEEGGAVVEDDEDDNNDDDDDEEEEDERKDVFWGWRKRERGLM